MNKLVKLALIATIAVAAVGCDKSDEFDNNLGTGIRSEFLVDKIYNYHNQLLAEYIYDHNNRLIKRIVTDTLVEQSGKIYHKWENEFEYKNGRVSKMKYHNQYLDKRFAINDLLESNLETTYEYDSQGRLIKENGEPLNFRYEDGRVTGSSYNNNKWIYTDTMVYDNSRSIIEHIHIVPELDLSGQPIPATSKRVVRYYEYDNNPKPNFGLDYLFTFNPLPYTEAAAMIRTLSNNNMTSAPEDGYAFVYTYYENGLPKTIETKWIGIDTTEPILLRITYKRIK